MKVLFFVAWSLFANISNDPIAEKKVMEQFERLYPQASEVKWHVEKNVYTCIFKIQDQNCQIKLDCSGKLLSSRRTLTVNHLPPFLVNKLSNQYKALLYGVTELTEGDLIVYEIVLQTSTKWMIIQADLFGNAELLRSFTKG